VKNKALFLPAFLILLLAACSGAAQSPSAIPTIVLGNTASTPASSTSTVASVTASGVIVADQEAHLAFQVAGNVKLVSVAVGDQVQAGQALVQLDDTTQQIQLEQANLALQQLTSQEAIANARLAVTTAESDVTNAQYGVDNLQYWKNKALIQDYYAKYVIAKNNLDKAQTAYDNLHVGEYINNVVEANAYQTLYLAKQAYDTAHYWWSVYSQEPTQRTKNEAQAKLDLANANLKNAQIYLNALTGGDVPADATGTALLQFEQAKLAVQTARANLDAARLSAPFSGTITDISGMVGDQVSPGMQAFRIDDLSQMKVDVQVSEVDINSVQPGQPVTLTFDAITGKTYNGKVVEVAQVGDVVQGAVNFTVTVVLTDQDTSVKPGMTAAVTIAVKQVNNALLVPNRAVRLIDNQQVVYILSNGQAVQVNINLGASSDTMSEVVSGDLKVGDMVILNPPTNLFTRPSGGGSPGGGGPFGGGG
jgi:HlyD family secretion protein